MDFDNNNPFAEPNRQSSTGQSFSAQPTSYDYNPFSGATSSSPPPPPVSPSAIYVPPPAPVPVFQSPSTYTPTSPSAYLPTSPSTYVPSSPPPVVTSVPSYYSSDQREASTRVDITALERQQAELADREKRLNNNNGAVSQTAPMMVIRKKNFPPLPARCPVGPCFYHDIQVDIPAPLQKWARFLYILWIVYSVTLLLNFIGGLSYFIVESSGGATFGLSLVYFVLFVPLSYICWYRPIYRALRTDSSVYYMLFFFISVLFIANNVLFATGFIEGMCGFRRLDVMSDNKVVGIMILILSILWTLISAAAVLLTIKVHRIYRASGASIEQAQRELQTAITTNPTVRGAARDAARDAAVVGINEAMRTDGH